MKQLILIVITFATICQIDAQNLEVEAFYPDTLRSSHDSFFVNSPQFNQIWTHVISKDDTLNLGTSGYKGVNMTIWTDLDTIEIPHVNFPYRQLIKIPIVSPNDTALCILRFQASTSNFDDDYALMSKGKFTVDIPEVYELANIILFLTECSEKTGNHPNSEYTKRLIRHFEPFRNHNLIKILSKNCTNSDYWSTYYGFRENSICYTFEGTSLQYNTPYKHVFWDDTRIYGGEFRKLLYLVQDFATKSRFQEFYTENSQFYERLKARQEELLPINQMWEWLENEFPSRMASYRIIFSPLIQGSHSTQKFQKGFFREPEFEECIMFINSPESLDAQSEYSETTKGGLMSGIVFTEIDHNYVNPTSKDNIEAIKNLIDNKDFWASQAAQTNYSSEFAIFNEYMTHAVFCLYIKENYESSDAQKVIEKRIQLMNKRGYPKFEQFNSILIDKMLESKFTIYEAYLEIIEDMHEIK